MKQIHPLYVIFFIALLSGCVKEDFSDCPAGIKVFFTYQSTYAGEGITPSDVDKMDLYIFDRETGILKAAIKDPNPQLSPDYFMSIKDLPTGKYRMVAWGGLKGDYTTVPAELKVDETTYDEAMVVFDHADEVTHAIGHLFFAELKEAEITTARKHHFYLPLIQNTNIINLTTEGLPRNDDRYCMYIHDSNSSYFFDNSFAPCCDFKYTSACNKDEQGQPHATVTVLKLADSRQPLLRLWNLTTGVCKYSINLVEILNTRGVDYDLQSEFDIHLKFNTDMSVDVTVNDWQVTEGGIKL